MGIWNIRIDLKMFAVANSKELLNSVADTIYQRCFKFKAKMLTFTSDGKNAQNWYAFECQKDKIAECECKTSVGMDRYIPADFFPFWKGLLEEFGKMLGNSGIVFCLFYIQYPSGEKKPIAYYSSPDGVDQQTSGNLKTAWGKHFEKALKSPVYLIGSQLIPYELYNTKAPRQVCYPDGADSSYDHMLEKKREKLASARSQKAKSEAAEKQPAVQEKRKGYFEIIVSDPENVPFGFN